ncbi:hypothetical protein RRG08_044086 [Elysia crispata]|uniref:Uncharacterized protein n=1 Tax=Elysia crispata TaxID=231223 RepID=A0AAE0Z7M6_9GAST|nr:hypothetical protein RRG08_044086 [Elysia crispata]
MILSVFAVQVALLITVVKTDFNHSSELYKKFLSDQDHRVRPALNASIPTDVYVGMHLISLREIVETQQYYLLNVWMEFVWRDEIRQWDPAQYGDVRVIYPNPGDTWLPRVLISNSVEKRDLFSGDYTLHGIFWDGTTRWYPGSVISGACTLDLTYFPFDTQICTLRFIPQAFEWDVNLIASKGSVDTSGYAPNCEWKLESTNSRKMSIPHEGMSLGSIYFDFHFSRRPAFYIINVFAPVILMSLLAPLVFVLPEESGERASYSVTLLLSLTVFLSMVAGKLPTCSQPLPLVVTYIFAMLIHSSLCVVCTVVQLRFIQTNADQARNQQIADKKACLVDGCPQHEKSGRKDNVKEQEDLNTSLNDHTSITNTILGTDGSPGSGYDGETVYNYKSGKLIKSYLKNSNVIMLPFFYISWFVVSFWFFIKFRVEQSKMNEPAEV